ncbi:MAG: alanine racemase [Proteobacteria bacterium]|nr:alanine racemase [Pseudomonadota bacterium]
MDTTALRHNLEVLRLAAGGAKVMAVVKANAYGHGLTQVAQALPGADSFAVARLEEGIALRQAGIRQPIVLLEGVFTPAQLAAAIAHGFELVVHEPSQLALLEACDTNARSILWLKVDTGMNRLGFRPEAFAVALTRLRALQPAPHEIRVLTHLACADERESAMTREQVARFDALIESQTSERGPRLVTSISNSAGALGWPEARGDWVRPGLALYGASPFAGEPASNFWLRPVMTMETTVIGLRRVLQAKRWVMAAPGWQLVTAASPSWRRAMAMVCCGACRTARRSRSRQHAACSSDVCRWI